MATIPPDMEVEAHFLAKEDGTIAGIALAEMIFHEVDPSLKVLSCMLFLVGFICVVIVFYHFYSYQVEWSRKDGDRVHKGLQFGKVYGKPRK